ncbi:unnamed protein product [Allacma fusca]|uniref:Uncharacterized protein n=1 Tax=Allacma fusca TaxID=39272 RepID=A0A8J2KNE5_9HEXA|nr:unnamed protein product [Allacma fusca]
MVSTYNQATNFGKHLPCKIVVQGGLVKQIRSPKLGNPFQRTNPARLKDIALTFLTGNLIKDISGDSYKSPGHQLELFANDASKTKFIDSPALFQVFPLSHTTPKNFITSDSVHAITLEYALYTNPFKSSVWFCIILVAFVAAAILSVGICPHDRITLVRVFLKAITLLKILLDQGQVGPNDWSKLSTFAGSKRFTYTIWLVFGVIISIWYKCFMETDVITGNEFMTDWKELHELENFTLLYPGLGRTGKQFCKKNCEIHLRQCSFSLNSFMCYDYEESFILQTRFAKHIFPSQFRLFCDEDLKSIIDNVLTLPKTALVVPANEFEFYWEQVRNQMRGKNLKFWHNRKTINDQLIRPTISVFLFGQVLNERYCHVAKRAKIMLSAGLYAFWEKWDKIRFPRCNTDYHSKVSRNGDVTPLSMESSLALALNAFIIGLLVCVGIFIGEVISLRYPCFSRKQLILP